MAAKEKENETKPVVGYMKHVGQGCWEGNRTYNTAVDEHLWPEKKVEKKDESSSDE